MHRLPAVFDPEFPVPTVFQHEERGPVRPKSVDMHIEAPAGTQYPENFFDHAAWLVEVMQHTVGVYVVEALIREWDICAASMQNACKISDSLARQANMFRRYVNSDSI